MPTQITPELLKPYLSGSKRHPKYKDTVQQYLELKVHADGEYPREIIEGVRPHEPQYIKERRKKVFAEITMPEIGKVLNSLSKIRKSSDWNIRYDEKAVNDPMVRIGETLYNYMDQNFPVFGSATGWLFNVGLKQYCIDSDAVCLVMPLKWQTEKDEFRKPFPFIFNSPNVIEFKEDDYAILKAEELVTRTLEGGGQIEVEVYYVVTTKEIIKYEQNANRSGWTAIDTFVHNSGKLPCFRLGGIAWMFSDGQYIWSSRLKPMLPFLKEAVREYSDLQASVEMHLFLERWEYDSPICPECNGSGTVIKDSVSVKCPKNCNSGNVERSPYQVHIVKPPMPGEAQAPTPPGGYYEKDVEIIKVQDARVDKHLFKALSAVAMEFLFKSPLAESGISKAYDREEANNLAHAIAEDLVRLLDLVYWHCNWQRYMGLMTDKNRILSFLPKIAVPEKFDLFTSAMLIEEIKSLPENTPGPIKKAAFTELAGKKFSHDGDVSKYVQLNLSLDPLPGVSVDEKAAMKTNGGVTEQDYVISCNIDQFITRAVEENPKFISTMTRADQMKILVTFAKEVIAANDAAATLLEEEVDGEPDLNDEPVV